MVGLVPALKSSNISLHHALREAAQTSAGGWLARRTQSLLVVSEIALALVVLIGAGLMIKSFLRILNTDPGFNPDNILIVETKLPFSKYPEGHRMATFYQQLLERVGALPGVSSAGAVSHVPLSGAIFTTPFIIEGLPAQERGDEVNYRKVSSNYFTAMGIPLREGRFFTEQDVEGSPHVTLINEFAARKHWPNESPIGKRVKYSRNPKTSWLTIVGVVGSIRDSGLDSEPEPEMYEHHLQNPGFLTVVARTSESPALMASAIRSEVWKLDKDIPVSQLKTMDRQLADSLSARRLNTTFFFLFAAIACVLAYTGIYAVMSFSVTQRTHEIGIRIALGARPRDVLKLVVTQGMRLALLGTMIGLAASFALTRVLTSLLYGVSVTDPATFVFVTLLLCGIAMLGSYIPARRATRMDPATALRYE
jgi:putative ABC transport system permease protein